MPSAPAIDLYDYTDFRAFLRDWIEGARAADRKVSHRWFARKVGSTNPSSLSHVIEGRRPLRPERVEAFVAALALHGDEAEYFRALVDEAHAATPAAASAAYARAAELRSIHRSGDVSTRDEFAFLASWVIPAVYELSRFPSFREDPEWIAARLDPPSTADEVRRALEVCLRLGYLRREGERLVPVDPTLQTPARVVRQATWALHREGLARAAETLRRLPGNTALQAETGFFGCVVAVPADKMGEIRKILYDVQHRICGMASEFSAPPDQVIHLAFAAVPVARAAPGSQ
jgi:uncharacterized protein (TIGR02147 family)